MPGYDTANYIYDVYKDADRKYGTPDFWIRYFNPNKNVPFTTNAVAESRAAWDSGGGHIGPISSPGTGRLGTNSSAAGFADGQVFGAGLQSATESVSQLKLPSNGVMYCWLDMEPSDILNSNYWDGWAQSINGWNWKRGGSYPLFASLYTRTCVDNGCSASNGSGASSCWAIWSQQPQRCGSVSNPPSWAADNCSHCGTSQPTKLWQFMIQHDCGNVLDVDLDVGAPGVNYNSYTFYLSSRP